MSVAKDNGRLVFEVTQGNLARTAAKAAGEDVDAGLSLELIAALFEDAVLTTGQEGLPVVRFSVAR
jgi:hypothetical protein